MLSQLASLLSQRWEFFLDLLWQHFLLASSAAAMSFVLGLAIGVLISEYPRFSGPVMAVVNVVYTIPSISMLGFLIPFTGIGTKTTLIALVVYGLMPIVRNTYTGFKSIDPEILEAAKAMGSTRWQILYKVKLPLAADVILAGVRSMVVMTIAMTGIASFVGAGGLGVAIYRGISTNNLPMTVLGSVFIALLALVSDFILGRVQKHIKKKRRITT